MNKLSEELNKIDIPSNLSNRSFYGVRNAKIEQDDLIKKRKKQFFLLGSIVTLLLMFSIGPSLFTKQTNVSKVESIDANYVIDIYNPNEVAGYADNVFLGEVIEKVKTSDGSYPTTQFNVKVIKNIKGDFQGTVSVSQTGGIQEGVLFLYNEDPLIQQGKTYLFATKYREEFKWNDVIPVGGKISYSTKIEAEEVVKKYKNAYKNEVPTDY